jgi:hypothetical protein
MRWQDGTVDCDTGEHTKEIPPSANTYVLRGNGEVASIDNCESVQVCASAQCSLAGGVTCSSAGGGSLDSQHGRQAWSINIEWIE